MCFFETTSSLLQIVSVVCSHEFRRRGWFTAVERSPAITEYVSFVTELQEHHVDSTGTPLPVVNIVTHFTGHELMVTKPLVQKIFKLSCLCLPIKGAVPPTPSLGLEAKDLSSEQARALMQPLYSFFKQVEPDFSFVLDEDALVECKEVLNLGSSLYSSDDYSPWEQVERADQDDTYSRLLVQYKLSREFASKE